MDPAWYLWPVFILLNGSAAGISLVAGVVSALSHTELEDLRRQDAKAAVSIERSRSDQGNTLAAFEVLSAAFVGMSALLGGFLLQGRFQNGLSASWQVGALTALAFIAAPVIKALVRTQLPVLEGLGGVMALGAIGWISCTP